jgi:hypothetical protein
MAFGDRRLQPVVAAAATRGIRSSQRAGAACDRGTIPVPPILLLECERQAVEADPGGEPRGLELHQCDERMHFRLARHEDSELTSESHRLARHVWTHRLLPLGR